MDYDIERFAVDVEVATVKPSTTSAIPYAAANSESAPTLPPPLTSSPSSSSSSSLSGADVSVSVDASSSTSSAQASVDTTTVDKKSMGELAATSSSPTPDSTATCQTETAAVTESSESISTAPSKVAENEASSTVSTAAAAAAAAVAAPTTSTTIPVDVAHSASSQTTASPTPPPPPPPFVVGVVNKADMQSFEEWKEMKLRDVQQQEQQQQHEQEQQLQQQKQQQQQQQQQQQRLLATEASSAASSSLASKEKVASSRRRKNYASLHCGAKLLAHNADASNPSHILTESKDEYMLNTCSSKSKWFIVELCEPVRISHIELANFELFSNVPRSFRVYVSERYQADHAKWPPGKHLLATFEAANTRTTQSFAVKSKLANHELNNTLFALPDAYSTTTTTTTTNLTATENNNNNTNNATNSNNQTAASTTSQATNLTSNAETNASAGGGESTSQQQQFSPATLNMYAKYIKFEMLSHYGSEHYCPLSLLRIYGSSLDDDDDEDDYEDAVAVAVALDNTPTATATATSAPTTTTATTTATPTTTTTSEQQAIPSKPTNTTTNEKQAATASLLYEMSSSFLAALMSVFVRHSTSTTTTTTTSAYSSTLNTVTTPSPTAESSTRAQTLQFDIYRLMCQDDALFSPGPDASESAALGASIRDDVVLAIDDDKHDNDNDEEDAFECCKCHARSAQQQLAQRTSLNWLNTYCGYYFTIVSTVVPTRYELLVNYAANMRWIPITGSIIDQSSNNESTLDVDEATSSGNYTRFTINQLAYLISNEWLDNQTAANQRQHLLRHRVRESIDLANGICGRRRPSTLTSTRQSPPQEASSTPQSTNRTEDSSVKEPLPVESKSKTGGDDIGSQPNTSTAAQQKQQLQATNEVSMAPTATITTTSTTTATTTAAAATATHATPSPSPPPPPTTTTTASVSTNEAPRVVVPPVQVTTFATPTAATSTSTTTSTDVGTTPPSSSSITSTVDSTLSPSVSSSPPPTDTVESTVQAAAEAATTTTTTTTTTMTTESATSTAASTTAPPPPPPPPPVSDATPQAAPLTPPLAVTSSMPPSTGTGGKVDAQSQIARLHERIRILELNMSLSSQYLEALSQNYKRKMDEMQLAFNLTTTALLDTIRIANERDVKQNERIGPLERRLEKALHTLDSLSLFVTELKFQVGSQQPTDRTLFFNSQMAKNKYQIDINAKLISKTFLNFMNEKQFEFELNFI